MNKNYKNPEFVINKVYTKQGDAGNTKLVGGQIRSKSDLRINCYGEIDELNSIIGGCIAVLNLIKNKTDSFLGLISNLMGALLIACKSKADINVSLVVPPIEHVVS